MSKIFALVASLAILAAGFYFGANAWERWLEIMKYRDLLKREATAHEIDRIAKGLELCSDAEREAAKRLVAEGRGQKKSPGRFALWLFRNMAR